MDLTTPVGHFKISHKFIDDVYGFPHSGDKLSHYKFQISIKYENKTARFFYYGSYNDYQKGKDYLEDEDLLLALGSILSDAIAGTSSYNDFISDFGYDPYDKNSKAIYREVQKSLDKVLNLGLTEDDIYTLSNWLREKYDI